jgi:hypothetical protein
MYVSLSSQVSEAHRHDLLAEAERLSLVAQALRERKAIRRHRVANAMARPLRKGLALAASLIDGMIG